MERWQDTKNEVRFMINCSFWPAKLDNYSDYIFVWIRKNMYNINIELKILRARLKRDGQMLIWKAQQML